MQILIGDRVKGAEATALGRLRQAVKDLDGLLLVNFYLGRCLIAQLSLQCAPAGFQWPDAADLGN